MLKPVEVICALVPQLTPREREQVIAALQWQPHPCHRGHRYRKASTVTEPGGYFTPAKVTTTFVCERCGSVIEA